MVTIDVSKWNSPDWDYIRHYASGVTIRDDLQVEYHASLARGVGWRPDYYHWCAPGNAIRDLSDPAPVWWLDIEAGNYGVPAKPVSIFDSAKQAIWDAGAVAARWHTQAGLYATLATFLDYRRTLAPLLDTGARLWVARWMRPSASNAAMIRGRLKASGINPEQWARWQFASGDAQYQAAPAGSLLRANPMARAGWLDCSIDPRGL